MRRVSEILPIMLKIHKSWWSKIIVHHSWSRDHGTLDTPGIRRYHSSYRIDGHIVGEIDYYRRKQAGDGRLFQEKWFDDDPGYHFLIEDYNKHTEIVIGRPLTEKGIHCKGMNNTSLGVCFIGNYDREPPPDAMLMYAVSHLFVPLLKTFDYPADIIEPHHKYADKSCPGKMFDMDKLRKAVSGVIEIAEK